MRVFWAFFLFLGFAFPVQAAPPSTCRSLTTLDDPTKIPWNCFDTAVAIVLRNVSQARGLEIDVCSGIAISPTRVLTAAHCVETAKRWNSDFDIYNDLKVDRWRLPLSIGKVAKADVHKRYLRASSLYLFDIGIIELETPLSSNLYYPPIFAVTDMTPLPAKIYRIGYGGRVPVSLTAGAATSPIENRRTFVTSVSKPFVFYESKPAAVVSDDIYAFPGDSGGPLYILEPRLTGGFELKLLAVHSTWDKASKLAFAPLLDPTLAASTP